MVSCKTQVSLTKMFFCTYGRRDFLFLLFFGEWFELTEGIVS